MSNCSLNHVIQLLIILIVYAFNQDTNKNGYRFTVVEAAMSPNSSNDDTPSTCYQVCTCKGHPSSLNQYVDCSGQNLTSMPCGFGVFTKHLDLSHNKIKSLPETSFLQHQLLESLNLADNDLTDLPDGLFSTVVGLHTLNLKNNKFEVVPSRAFKPLRTTLESLHLDGNPFHTIDPKGFEKLTKLKKLLLNGTEISEIPFAALKHLTSLEALTLANCKIEAIPNHAFQNQTRLSVLLLYHNRISHIGEHSFVGLNNLRILNLYHNELSEVPSALAQLTHIEELSLSNNHISYIPDKSFTHNKHLTTLSLKNNPIQSVGKFAFSNLPQLKNLVLSEARRQSIFPDLSGNLKLETLALDRGNIDKLPADLCKQVPNLISFDIHANQLTSVPNLKECSKLKALNLRSNKISSLRDGLFSSLSLLTDLTLSDNNIETIPQNAFIGLSFLLYFYFKAYLYDMAFPPSLPYLTYWIPRDLQNNHISFIHQNAFAPLIRLEDLNLADNVFPELPTKGLERIRNLKAYNNYQLKDFPSREHFPVVETLTLSWAYHCCEYVTDDENIDTNPGLKEDITFIDDEIDENTNYTSLIPIGNKKHVNLEHRKVKTAHFAAFEEDLWSEYDGESYGYPVGDPIGDYSGYNSDINHDFVVTKKKVVCKPRPGPFWPCKDLMGWWFIRCGMWVVFLLALLGNGTVLLVSIVGKNKTDVPRFLICNLACADLLMGVYLGFLAVVDASSFGEFKKYAIKWQTSVFCQIAGFLGVLSSELSVYTLTVITMERYYAITHAVHINRRLSYKPAAYIMCCGWLFALIMAILPLTGVSDYRKFAVCLPFEANDGISLGYIAFLMLMNIIAFFLIVGCYGKMYWSIRGSSAWNSNDSRVAKRMAILIFTDFFCWAPISFFSLTAAFGQHLVSLDDAKIFTIFVLPLNSCANPFLYAILTKQFKKDCSVFCKRIEESTINRNINRLHQRNSVTWGSSRRPSALNSFFDKRDSVSGRSVSAVSQQNPAWIQNPLLKAIQTFLNKHKSKKPKRTCIHIRGEDLMAAFAPNIEACSNPSANNVPPPVYDSAQDVCICHSGGNEQDFNSNSDSSTGGTCIAHFFRNKSNARKDHKEYNHRLTCPINKETKNDLSVLQLVTLKCSPGGARKQPNVIVSSKCTIKHSSSKRLHAKLKVNLSGCSMVSSPKLLSAGDESVKTNNTGETDLSYISSCLDNNQSDNENDGKNRFNEIKTNSSVYTNQYNHRVHPSDECLLNSHLTTHHKTGDVHLKEKARLLGLNEDDFTICNNKPSNDIPLKHLKSRSCNLNNNDSGYHVVEIHNRKNDEKQVLDPGVHELEPLNKDICGCYKHSSHVDTKLKSENNDLCECQVKPIIQSCLLNNKYNGVTLSNAKVQGCCDNNIKSRSNTDSVNKQQGDTDSVNKQQGNSIDKHCVRGKLSKDSSNRSNTLQKPVQSKGDSIKFNFDVVPRVDSNSVISNKGKVVSDFHQKESNQLNYSHCGKENGIENSISAVGLLSNGISYGGDREMYKLSNLKKTSLDSDESSCECDHLLKQGN